MRFNIIADSSCDLSDKMKKDMNVEIVPLTLRLEDREYVDDESLNVKEYVKDMGECKTSPKTSCPSPMDFIKKYSKEGSSFVVTLSSKLSATYQSAITAKNMFLEENSQKFIHVFDSLSASAGETVICRKIYELSQNGAGELEIVEKVSKYISEMKTLFLLESLEHLAKAGRLNTIVAKVASVLDIKPIMGANEDGNIKLIEKIRGYKRAFNRFIEVIGEECADTSDKIIGISYCNCLDRAILLKEEILKRYKFKEIILSEMAGLSSTYSDDGGLVIAF